MASFSMQFDISGSDLVSEEGEVSEVALAIAIQKVARKVRDLTTSGVVQDGNGNTLGTFDIEGVNW